MGVLERLGIHADVGIGHSLGELAAYHWAGALSQKGVIRLASARGRAMADFGKPGGAMAGIAAGRDEVEQLMAGSSVVAAGLNAPRQTVVSGTATEIDALVDRAAKTGFQARRLPVSHAFHSPLVADAQPALHAALQAEKFDPISKTVASTVTGVPVAADDLRELLLRQLTSPVRFMDAVGAVSDRVDLWIEVGPGNVLSRIASQFVDKPVVATDAAGSSIRPLLQTVGAAYVTGVAIGVPTLDQDRATPAEPASLGFRRW